MKIAVTGGAGFIGSRLIRALRNRGVEVRALLAPRGVDVRCPPPDDVDCCFGMIDDEKIVRRLVDDVAVVVHLAGPRSVAASFNAARLYIDTHVRGTGTVVDVCIRNNIRRLVYVSSAEVYGQPDRNPVDEEAPLAPRSPYAAAKIGAEAFVRVGALAADIETVIVRPFLVYGPGMAEDTLLYTLMRDALAGRDIQLANLRPVRDYCYVDDVVSALTATCVDKLPQRQRVYNVGSGVGVSVAQLAERVLEGVGRNTPILEASCDDRPRYAEIRELVSDSSRAAHELAWWATTSLESGLAIMARAQINNLT